MIRVLLADDHAVVAEGLAALLRESFELVGDVRNGRELLTSATQLRPDVIVTDITMPFMNGLDAIRQIMKEHPDMKVVVLTMHNDPRLAVLAIRAGVRGYVIKTAPAEELIAAVDARALWARYGL